MTPNECLAQRALQVCGAPAHEVPSPCISVCRMNSVTALCIGCFRTLDEISEWGRMEDGAKRKVWGLIAGRLEKEKTL
ncbi:MAG TPA: DUF1289 domain-containing protein [Ramlibacter sp.]|nr:DUF1289 domain-containing protein [Ramlibacter sp.]